MAIVSRRAAAADKAFEAVKSFYFSSRYGERRGDPTIADFTSGNPHEMPLDGLVAAIREGAVPLDENWFAYKSSEEAPQAFLAEAIGHELGLPLEPSDVALTAGAFGADREVARVHERSELYVPVATVTSGSLPSASRLLAFVKW